MNEIEELIKKYNRKIVKMQRAKFIFENTKKINIENYINTIAELEQLKESLNQEITEQQALNKLAERFPMTTDQIVSTLEMSQTGVNHEPVEVPEFIKNVMQKYKSLQDMLTEEYYSNDTSENDNDAVFCWIDTNFDLLCRAWLDGCRVAKEPLYIVKVGAKYFQSWLNLTSITPVCMSNMDDAWAFSKKDRANKVAKLIGGEVVPVEEEAE